MIGDREEFPKRIKLQSEPRMPWPLFVQALIFVGFVFGIDYFRDQTLDVSPEALGLGLLVLLALYFDRLLRRLIWSVERRGP